jgi:hypothetical protein
VNGLARLAASLSFALVVAVASAGAAPTPGSWARLPQAPARIDSYLAGAWTGRELVVFGRRQVTKLDARGNPYSVRSLDVAAAYDPARRAWRKLAPRPGPTGSYEGRYSVVWTGHEVLVWGPFDVQAYTPATNRWRALPRPPGGGAGGLVVWSGRELLGWGGGCCGDAWSTGVAYDPSKNRWRKLPGGPLAASQHPVGAWNGRELVLVVGNLTPDGKPWPARLARAAAYDPASNTWRRLSPLPGGVAQQAVWNGRDVLVLTNGGAVFALDPVANTWRRLTRLGPARLGAAVGWTGRRLLVWGGKTPGGIAYDPAANRSAPLPRSPLAARQDAVSAWTGRALLVWGGRAPANGKPLADGAAFTPASP